MTHGRVSLHGIMTGLAVISLAARAPIRGEEAKPSPEAAKAAEWVRQLGSEEYEEREEAKRNLLKAGDAAVAALNAADRDTDAEVQQSRKQLLLELMDKPLCAQAKVFLCRYAWQDAPGDWSAVLGEEDWTATKAKIKKGIEDRNEVLRASLKVIEKPCAGVAKIGLMQRVELDQNEKDLKALETPIDFKEESVAVVVRRSFLLPERVSLVPCLDRWVIQVAVNLRAGELSPTVVLMRLPKSSKPVDFEATYLVIDQSWPGGP